MCTALDTRMDEDGYRKPLLARRRRVKTRVSLISSHDVTHDVLFVGFFRVSTVSRRAVSFGMRFDDNRGSRLVLLHLPKKRRMYDTCSCSKAYHSGRECKESLAFMFIRHRCAYFRLQTDSWWLPCSSSEACVVG